MVELAEMLVTTIPWSSWAYFAKNGSDATGIAVRMARAATGKRIILRAPSSYHGSRALWQEGSRKRLFRQGIVEEDTSHIRPFVFNDLDSVRKAVARDGMDIAAIIVAAFKWDYAQPQELPTKEFLEGIRRICDEQGAAFACIADVWVQDHIALARGWGGT
eukprot:m.348176 g.348176  ORF g.348176 m.348176 type:complete len:161 (+) comp20672_c1_seq43:526-1008(+)